MLSATRRRITKRPRAAVCDEFGMLQRGPSLQTFDATVNPAPLKRERALAAQIAHAKTAIEAKRETFSGMVEILGVNCSTLQRAMARDMKDTV